MTLFFQNPSVGLALLLFPRISRAKKVVFYRPYWLSTEGMPAGRGGWAEKLIRRMNPRAEVKEHEPEEAFPLAHENNIASDRYMEELFPRVRDSASFRILLGLIRDPHIDRFYKIRLLPHLLYETQFYRTARRLIDSGEQVWVIPASRDRRGLSRHFFTEQEIRRAVPAAARWALALKDRLGLWIHRLLGINLFLLLSPPLLFLAKTGWRSGLRGRSEPVRADVVMPLIWGFSENGSYRGLKTGLDNSFLLGGELEPSRVAFYFSDWSFTPEERRLQEERMNRRGIRYFDPARFPLTPEFIREAAARYGRLLLEILRRPGLLLEERETAWISSALLHNLFKGRHFIGGVEYKVLMESQDYSAAHVVRTILSEQAGRLTVGDHHGAPDGAAGFPVLRYTHIHRHCVWGEAFLKSYGAHWDHMKNFLIGSWRTDFVKAAQEEGRLGELQHLFKNLYGGRRPLAVILFPTLEKHNHFGRIQEVVEGLRLLKRLPGDFTVICRFRSVELAGRYRALGLEEVLRDDPRIRIDLTDFTTYEWFALSDMVIVSSISTGMIEAAAAGKPTFTFDHRFLAEKVFAPYGKELVLKTRHDLVSVFEKVLSGSGRFECRWDRLARDFSHHSDGECVERYRQTILRAVEEAGTN